VTQQDRAGGICRLEAGGLASELREIKQSSS